MCEALLRYIVRWLCDAALHCAVWCGLIQCSTLRYCAALSDVWCFTALSGAVRCALVHNAVCPARCCAALHCAVWYVACGTIGAVLCCAARGKVWCCTALPVRCSAVRFGARCHAMLRLGAALHRCCGALRKALLRCTMRCLMLRCTVWCGVVRCGAVQCSALQGCAAHSAVWCCAALCCAVRCALVHNAVR
jgi:hypothetical protein